jgi:DNA-binding MarR family transcriptional regulator
LNKNLKKSPDDTALSVSAKEIRYLILAVQREGNRYLSEILRKVNLTPAQAEVITVLAANEPITLIGLGKLLVCETGSPSRLVNSLVQKELVAQEKHVTDGRAKLFSLTPAGRNALRIVQEAEETVDAFLDSSLSTEAKRVLGKSLYRILKGTVLEQVMLKRFHAT